MPIPAIAPCDQIRSLAYSLLYDCLHSIVIIATAVYEKRPRGNRLAPALRKSCCLFTRTRQRIEDAFRRKRLMPYLGSKRLEGIIDSNPHRSHRADQATFADA